MFIELMILNIVVHGAAIFQFVPSMVVHREAERIKEIEEQKRIEKQSLIESRTASARDRAVVAVNHAKWQAATAYCKMQGFAFRVITEDDLFRNGTRK